MAKSTVGVNQLIRQLGAEQREIALTLRGLIRKVGTGLHESIKWGCPCYVGTGIVCSIVPYADHVNLALFRGAELEDPDELLSGTGKAMRHVKIRSTKGIRKRAITTLIRSAVSLDRESAV